MDESGNIFGYLAVSVVVLARESVEKIPYARDLELAGPFQELHVLQEGAPFPHELQHRSAQVLDPRLQVDHPGECELTQVLLLEIHLHFEVKVVSGVALDQLRDHGIEILHVHDVVGNVEDLAVLMAEFFNLIERALRRLAAITHGRTVQSAEGAVLFGSPPAPARGFERNDGLDAVEQTIFF